MIQKTLSLMLSILCFFSLNACAMAQKAPVIAEGKKVILHYTMEMDGNVIDSTHNREPLEFVYGTDPILPGIQKGIAGLKEGDQKQLTVAPEDAFGQPNPQAVITVPKEQLGKEDVQTGMMFTMPQPNGQTLRGIVTEVNEDSVILDFNHPLAGKELVITVEIVEVV